MKNLTFDCLPEAIAGLHNKLVSIEKLLQEQSCRPYPEEDRLLTIQEAANLLSLSPQTLYGYVHRKEIPVNKRGNRLYFSKQELTDWVKAARKKTIDEIESEAADCLRELNKKRG